LAFNISLIFIGQDIGLKWEKIGGYMIVVPISIASLIGFVLLKEGLPGPMFITMFVGILYPIIVYKKIK
jgi:hypothetical protein